MTSRSEAHALHELLMALRETGKIALKDAWSEVLEAPFGEPEFARRHAEVVSMLTTTLNQLEAIPNASTRERYRQFTVPWWVAVIGVNWAWQGNMGQVSGVITDEHLALLGSAADIIESRFEGTSDAPTGFHLEPLREQCQEWLNVLDGELDISPALKLSLMQDLEHVLWLIENADKFGVARVARAGQSVVGGLALASSNVPKAKQPMWVEKAKALSGCLLALSALMGATTTAINTGDNLMHELASAAPNDGGQSNHPAAGD